MRKEREDGTERIPHVITEAAVSAAGGAGRRFLPFVLGALLLPVLFVVLLPPVIFGSFRGDGSSEPGVLCDDARFLSHMTDLKAGIESVLSEGMEKTREAVDTDFRNSGLDAMEVHNPYAGQIVFSATRLISLYCAGRWEDPECISKDDLEEVLRTNSGRLYSFTYRDELREMPARNGEHGTGEQTPQSRTVRVYSIRYNGERFFGEDILGLREEQKALAEDYAENLSALLQESAYRTLTGEDVFSAGMQTPFSDGEIDGGILIHPGNKNARDLAAYALNACEHGWGYVWGTCGNRMTEDLLRSLCDRYGEEVGTKETTIREKWMGHRVTDCSGLLKSYCWYDPDTGSIGYETNGMPDINADRMYGEALVAGSIDTIPEVPGIVVWRKGHVGVYLGNGRVAEAKGTEDGVVLSQLSERGFTHWFELAFISY